MNWLWLGTELVGGVALLVIVVVVISLLRPSPGQMQERLIISFPGAWIIVGLPLTFAVATSMSLIAMGLGLLH
jgi:hypothetical protein